MKRNEAYFWLADQLNIDKKEAHFSTMSREHIIKAIQVCREYLENNCILY